MAPSGPDITIVTPVLNGGAYIADALASVACQDSGLSIQHLIIDGGSTDDTRCIVARFPHATFVERVDDSLYSAINAGLDLAEGPIVGLLNSDDLYRVGTFKPMLDLFAAHPSADMVCCGAELVDTRGHLLARWRGPDLAAATPYPLGRGVPAINARFFRRGAFGRVGRFDASFRIAGDREFLIRARLSGLNVLGSSIVAYVYRQNPGSLTLSGRALPSLAAIRENSRVAQRFISVPDPAIRREMRLWHGREMLLGALVAIGAGDVRGARLAVSEAIAADPGVLLHGATALRDWMAQRLASWAKQGAQRQD